MIMKICWNTIHVRDMNMSEKFYKEVLSLKEVSRKKPNETIELLFLEDDNGMQIELLYDKTHEFKQVENIISIGITTNNLDIYMNELNKMDVSIKRGPVLLGGKTRCIFIEDPNGLEIQVIEK